MDASGLQLAASRLDIPFTLDRPEFVWIEVVVIEPDGVLKAVVTIVFDFVASFVFGNQENRQLG